MGHIDVECASPAPRNAEGKLPYDLKLRADDRKKRMQSFSEAAAESYGSGSFSASKPSKRASGNSDDLRSENLKGTQTVEKDVEVTSPLKERGARTANASSKHGTTRQLFQAKKGEQQQTVRKRKSKVVSGIPTTAPDLNLPMDTTALVPAGLVSSRVNQLAGTRDGNEDGQTEVPKKQKCSTNSDDARSAAAVDDSSRRAQ